MRFMRNSLAQFHVLEAVFVAGMLLLSLLFISHFSAPPTVETIPENQLKIRGDEALRSLDLLPTASGSYHDSRLTQYIFTNDFTNFISFIDEMLPSAVLYNVWLYNTSSRNSVFWCSNHANSARKQEMIGTTVRSHRSIVNEGIVYDVELEMCML